MIRGNWCARARSPAGVWSRNGCRTLHWSRSSQLTGWVACGLRCSSARRGAGDVPRLRCASSRRGELRPSTCRSRTTRRTVQCEHAVFVLQKGSRIRGCDGPGSGVPRSRDRTAGIRLCFAGRVQPNVSTLIRAIRGSHRCRQRHALFRELAACRRYLPRDGMVNCMVAITTSPQRVRAVNDFAFGVQGHSRTGPAERRGLRKDAAGFVDCTRLSGGALFKHSAAVGKWRGRRRHGGWRRLRASLRAAALRARRLGRGLRAISRAGVLRAHGELLGTQIPTRRLRGGGWTLRRWSFRRGGVSRQIRQEWGSSFAHKGGRSV